MAKLILRPKPTSSVLDMRPVASTATSEALAEMNAAVEEVREISGLTGEDDAVSNLVDDTDTQTWASVANAVEDATRIVTADPARFPGVDPTGATDDAAAIQAVIDATPDGALCRIYGKHQIGTALTNRGRSITLDLSGAELIRSGSAGIIVDFYGDAQTIYDVTSVVSGTTALPDGTRRTVTITVTSGTPAYVEGQLVKLIADNVTTGVRPGSGDGKEARSGEYLVVQNVAGSVVTCLGVLQEAYTTNVRLAALPATDVKIIGGALSVPAAGIAAGWASSLTRMRNLPRPKIEGTQVKSSGGPAFTFIGCPGYSVSDADVDFALNSPSTSQFGYMVADISCFLGKISGGSGSHIRHAFTDTAPWVAADSDEYWYYGRTRTAKVDGVTAFASTNTAFDTHSWADGIEYANCTAVSCFAGFAWRGKRHKITNGKAIDCNRGLYYFTESSGGDSYGHVVDGLVLDNCAIPLLVDVNPVGHPSAGVRETRPVRIRNLVILGAGNSTITNATLLIDGLSVEAAATLADSSRLFTLTNSWMELDNVFYDYRQNTAGASLAIFRLEATATLITTDRQRYEANPARATSLTNLIDCASGALVQMGGLDASHAPSSSVITNSAAGGWSDWATRSDGRNSGYVEGTDNVATAGSSFFTWIGRTRRPAIVARALLTASQTMLALPDGKVRGQILRIANWSTGAFNLTIQHGSSSFNIITKTGANVVLAPMDSITLTWNGTDWYQV